MEKPAPLTPSDCDLRDFQFMPVDVHRLLTSETWILGTGDERAAAMTLWLASWHQVPAGSIPQDDRMLAHLSQSGPKWKKLKAHTLRGWVEARDGRLYHPVVAEKALEAWVEKLAYSLSGSAGNAKRWGVSIETDSTRDRALVAISMLRALAPQSKTLKKKAIAVIESGSQTESGGDTNTSGGDPSKPSGGDSGGDPPRIARDSKGTVKGQGLLTPTIPDGIVVASDADDPLSCPVGALVGLYHELMPDNPQVKVLNDARKRMIRARWAEAAKLDCEPFGYSTRSAGIEAWRQFFTICAESKFLTGCAPSAAGKPPFIADIDFLFSASGFAKTLENKYHRDAA